MYTPPRNPLSTHPIMDSLDIAHKKQQQDTKDAELVAVLADVTEQQRELQKQVAAMMRLMAEQVGDSLFALCCAAPRLTYYIVGAGGTARACRGGGDS